MVPFAGYLMPVQYPEGILKEHLHTRAAAGLFDVSHMGQVRISGANVAAELEKILPIDVIDLPLNQQRYAVFTNAQGGILDDLMVTNRGDHFLLVVNAGYKARRRCPFCAQLLGLDSRSNSMFERALLALQGPTARAVVDALGARRSRFEIHASCELVDCGY